MNIYTYMNTYCFVVYVLATQAHRRTERDGLPRAFIRHQLEQPELRASAA